MPYCCDAVVSRRARLDGRPTRLLHRCDSGTLVLAAVIAPLVVASCEAPRMAAVRPSTVLVVEDDDGIRELLVMLLDAEGFTVVEAADGAGAIRAIAQLRRRPRSLGIVLLDLMLPKIDGLAVLRYLCALTPPPPVVAMSASRALLAEAILAGATIALAKPFEVTDVLAVVAQHCARSAR